MADDKRKRGKPDRNRVDPKDPNEVRHLAKQNDVAIKVAKEAAEKFGPMRADIQKALAKLKKR